MFLYSGTTPELTDIFSKLIEAALICIVEELIKKTFTANYNSKELVIIFNNNSVILLGTAVRLS